MSGSSLRVEQEGPLTYLIAVPEGQAAVLHPLLVFLHGYDEGPPADIRAALTRHGPLRPGNAVASLGTFIVVAPQMPVRGDRWHQYADDVRATVRQVQRARGGDPRRTYLTGFSFGGNGVFDLALLQPDTWAALWAVDPTRVPPRDPRRPIWLSVGEVARHSKPRFIGALKLEPLPARGGIGDRVYLDEGADHVGSATLAYRDARIYDWLLGTRLESPASAE